MFGLVCSVPGGTQAGERRSQGQIQRDPELMEGRFHRQLQHLQRNTESATRVHTLSPPGEQSASERHPTQRPTTRRTWPAPDGRHTAGVPKTAGFSTPTRPRASALGSAMAASNTCTDTDADTVTDTGIDSNGNGDDDVYDGWGDYYLDEENFHGWNESCGKDGQDVYTGSEDGCCEPSLLDEFMSGPWEAEVI